MKRRIYEGIAAVTLVAAAALGTSACSGNTTAAPRSTETALATPETRIKQLAGELITMYNKAPENTRFAGKPDGAVSFDWVIGGSAVMFTEQSSDMSSFDQRVASANQVELDYNDMQGQKFGIDFVKDGSSWNVSCSDSKHYYEVIGNTFTDGPMLKSQSSINASVARQSIINDAENVRQAAANNAAIPDPNNVCAIANMM